MTQAAAPRKSLEPFLKDDVKYYGHQTDGVRWCINKPSFILADDMGLGKSLQALTVFCIDVKIGKAQTCIIVCPVTLRDNWAEEIEKFTRIPYLLLGEEPHPTRRGEMRKTTPKVRGEQLKTWLAGNGPRILIMNYEQLSAKEIQPLLATAKIDVAIYDEAHYLKNPTSLRSKRGLALSASRSFMLTGTPMLNQVNELWALLHRCDPKRFPDYWKFVNRYCVFGGYENRQIVGVKNQLELQKILGEYMIRRMKKDTLNRDEPTIIPVYVGLSKEQQELYDSVLDDLLLPDDNGGEAIENPLTKFLRLKQICGTPYSINPLYPDSSLKLDRVMEIVQHYADQGEKVVVFTQFRGVLDAFLQRMEKVKDKAGHKPPVFTLHGDTKQKERQPTVHAWSEVQGTAVMACMIQVAGVGLNMTAASVCIFIDKLFTPGLNKQGIDRLDRIGQTEPVQVYEVITRGTVEQRVEEILKMKEFLNNDIVEGSASMRTLLEKLKEKLRGNL